jgi:predicted permease
MRDPATPTAASRKTTWARELRSHLSGLHLSPAREAAIVEELAQHLDDRHRELVAGGMKTDEAAATVLHELKHADRLHRRLSALRQAHVPEPARPSTPLTSPFIGLVQDLRYVVRTLARQPLFALIAVLTLALGIGLNTAMFSFLNALLLRPLPFPDADRLVRLYRTTPQNQHGGFSPADYLSLAADQDGFGRVAAYLQSNITFSEPGRATQWLRVSTNLFDVLGVAPALGRQFNAGDESGGSDHRVVMISDAVWRDRFASAPDIVGRVIRGNDQPYEIIGVLPPAAGDHRLFGQVGFFSPLAFSADARRTHSPHSVTILARRHSALSAAAGDAFIAAYGARMAADFPRENERAGWRSESLPATATGPQGRVLLVMLLGLSGFVLLIACSNLANLLLARAIERARELAVRASLGASRLQLVRTQLLECAVLAALGGGGALLVATWTTDWLRSVVANGGGPSFMFPLDWRVLGFALGASTLTILMCGLGPVLFTGRLNTNETLKAGGRGATGGRGHQRLRHALIVGQFTLAMTLLAGAGFFVRGVTYMLHDHYGWNAENVVQAEISMPSARERPSAAIVAFHKQLLERVQGLPGVSKASISYGLPYIGLRGNGRYAVEARDPSAENEVPAKLNGVTPAYFDVTGTRLLGGRFFTDADTTGSPDVAIINDAMARTLFPGGNAVGARLRDSTADNAAWMEIVGVVGDVRSIDVAQPPASYQLYQPAAQDPHSDFTLAVRVSGPGASGIAGTLGTAIASVDPNLTVRALMPVTARMAEVTSQMHLCVQLLLAFAVLGVVLAGVGIYGAMARMVAQRTNEIGLRLALGAQVASVVGLVLTSGVRIVGMGAAAGLLGAFGLSRLLASVLPTMRTDGTLVSMSGAGLLVAIALIACYAPARSATRVNPIEALRTE